MMYRRATRVAGCALLSAVLTVTALALGCSPNDDEGVYDTFSASFRIEASEASAAYHFTAFAEAERVAHMHGVVTATVRVCRADQMPLGTSLGTVRVIADGPSVALGMLELRAGIACATLAVVIADCEPAAAGARFTCGFTAEVDRGTEDDLGALDVDVTSTIVVFAGYDYPGFVFGTEQDD